MKFIPVAQPAIDETEERLVQECVRSTWISSTGKFVERFESDFARIFKTRHAISCTNGTVALHLALLALGIKPGDEVIVPVLTFVATANAVAYVGAKPVFVDIDPHTWNIDPQALSKKITAKTRAIIPVHLYGYPADLRPIMQLAKKHKLFVIEDAAEAHCAKYFGSYVGTIGDIGCFSFFGNKIVTTGEGGMVITNNKRLAQKVRLLKNHGMSPHKRYFHPIIGYNYRLTNVAAAIGCAQLQKLPALLKKRHSHEVLYYDLLKDVPGLVFQPTQTNINPVCWLFSMRVTRAYGHSRNELIAHLRSKGIDSRPFFYPLTSFPMYRSPNRFPVATRISREGINLPSSPNLTAAHIAYIANVIRNFQRS